MRRLGRNLRNLPRAWAGTLVTVALLALSQTIQPAGAGEPPASFECMVEPKMVVKLGAQASGILSSVLVDRGQRIAAGQTVLIHGAGGNVGAYAVQLAKQASLHVVATAGSVDLDYVRGLGADTIVDYKRGAIRGVGDWRGCCPGYGRRRYAAAVAPSSEARWDLGLCRVTCSRGGTNTL